MSEYQMVCLQKITVSGASAIFFISENTSIASWWKETVLYNIKMSPCQTKMCSWISSTYTNTTFTFSLDSLSSKRCMSNIPIHLWMLLPHYGHISPQYCENVLYYHSVNVRIWTLFILLVMLCSLPSVRTFGDMNTKAYYNNVGSVLFKHSEGSTGNIEKYQSYPFEICKSPQSQIKLPMICWQYVKENLKHTLWVSFGFMCLFQQL